MAGTILDRMRAMFVAPVSDPSEKAAAKAEAKRALDEAHALRDEHEWHRQRNHISERLAAAYRTDSRR